MSPPPITCNNLWLQARGATNHEGRDKDHLYSLVPTTYHVYVYMYTSTVMYVQSKAGNIGLWFK